MVGGITAHHIAGVLEPICQMVAAVVAGRASAAAFHLDMVDAMSCPPVDFARFRSTMG
jgi:cysteine sulfinate desulfinase/cysteine desulfurase-like protein